MKSRTSKNPEKGWNFSKKKLFYCFLFFWIFFIFALTAGIAYSRVDLEKFRGAEKTEKKTWFLQKVIFFSILWNRCSVVSDLKFEFSAKDLVKEKPYNRIRWPKRLFLTVFELLQVRSREAVEAI